MSWEIFLNKVDDWLKSGNKLTLLEYLDWTKEEYEDYLMENL